MTACRWSIVEKSLPYAACSSGCCSSNVLPSPHSLELSWIICTYVRVDLHVGIPAPHYVIHFAEGCPSEIYPFNLQENVAILRDGPAQVDVALHLLYSRAVHNNVSCLLNMTFVLPRCRFNQTGLLVVWRSFSIFSSSCGV